MVGTEVSRPDVSAADLIELLEPVAGDLQRVEDLLSEQVDGFPAGVGSFVQYALSGPGKRLRPGLALLAGGATGRIGEDQVKLGVIVELIHIATLVHDDVLDEAQLRHGSSTANSRWGNDISVLLGDCLFAHALELAASYPTTEVCRRISRATNTVCSGEILQNQARFQLDLPLGKYLEIIEMKTGALFAVSCQLGALLNKSASTVVEALSDYGVNLGMAYQIYDDCVDLFGQERQAGKSLGTDMKKGKLTLPFLLLLNQADARQRETLGRSVFSPEPQIRQQLASLIRGNGVADDSLATIERFLGRARHSLASLPENNYTRRLGQLADYLAGQSRRLFRSAVPAGGTRT